MSRQDPVNDIDEFWGYLTASYLVSPNQFRSLLCEFKEFVATSSITGDLVTAFGDFLFTNNTLTRWQISKLRNRKYKGFFLDHYILRDKADDGPKHSGFVAKNTRTNQLVILCVKAPGGGPTGPEYWVEEYRP